MEIPEAKLERRHCGEGIDESHRLARDEIRRFHQDGFVGPIKLCEPDQMREIKAKVIEEVLSTEGFCWERDGERQGLGPLRFRHLDKRIVYDLCAHPAVVESMACLYGPDLIVWKTQFFNKPPGGKALPWHQDYKYWPLDPVVNISAWIALDDATEENGCVVALPGSHRTVLPHVPAPTDPNYAANFFETVDPAEVEKWPKVSWPMKAGEFFLFSNPVHGSAQNNSPHHRLALVTRVTIPIVKVDHDSLFPGHNNLVIRGRDTMGFNRIGQPPA